MLQFSYSSWKCIHRFMCLTWFFGFRILICHYVYCCAWDDLAFSPHIFYIILPAWRVILSLLTWFLGIGSWHRRMLQAFWWCIIMIHQGYRSSHGATCLVLTGFTFPLPLIRTLVSSSVNTYRPKTAMQKSCLNSSETWVMFRGCLFSHLPVSYDLQGFEIMSILQKEETLVWVWAPHDSGLECADVLDILLYMANIRRLNLLRWHLKGPAVWFPTSND